MRKLAGMTSGSSSRGLKRALSCQLIGHEANRRSGAFLL
jgi:hypothetical protein